MQTTTENTQSKKALKGKKKSTVKKSSARKPKLSAVASESTSLLQDAKAYLSSRTRGQKAAIAAGAVGFLTLLANRRGRGLLKTLGGIALPIAASMAQDKIVERASRAI